MGLTDRNNPQSFEEMAAAQEKEDVKEVEATEEQEPQTDTPVEPTE